MSWSSLPVGYEIKSITSGSVDLLSNSLKVAVDTPPSPIRVLLSVDGNPWVKVSGRVTNLGSYQTFLLNRPKRAPDSIDGESVMGPLKLRRPCLERTSCASTTTDLRRRYHWLHKSVSVVIPNQDTTNLIIPLPLTKDVPGDRCERLRCWCSRSAVAELSAA